jgi:hypothetical protein
VDPPYEAEWMLDPVLNPVSKCRRHAVKCRGLGREKILRLKVIKW